MSGTSASFVEKSSSVTQTKLDGILFCSEGNSAEYSQIEEPIRLRKKHYPPARFMLNTNILEVIARTIRLGDRRT